MKKRFIIMSIIFSVLLMYGYSAETYSSIRFGEKVTKYNLKKITSEGLFDVYVTICKEDLLEKSMYYDSIFYVMVSTKTNNIIGIGALMHVPKTASELSLLSAIKTSYPIMLGTAATTNNEAWTLIFMDSPDAMVRTDNARDEFVWMTALQEYDRERFMYMVRIQSLRVNREGQRLLRNAFRIKK